MNYAIATPMGYILKLFQTRDEAERAIEKDSGYYVVHVPYGSEYVGNADRSKGRVCVWSNEGFPLFFLS